MRRLSILTAIILAAAALMASFQNCYACTGITLKAKDGSTVVARTIEWAASDNDCRWVVVPRGHRWKSFIPGGGTGRSFTNEYGYVGVAVVQDEIARVNIHGFDPRSSTEKFGNLLNIK